MSSPPSSPPSYPSSNPSCIPSAQGLDRDFHRSSVAAVPRSTDLDRDKENEVDAANPPERVPRVAEAAAVAHVQGEGEAEDADDTDSDDDLVPLSKRRESSRSVVPFVAIAAEKKGFEDKVTLLPRRALLCLTAKNTPSGATKPTSKPLQSVPESKASVRVPRDVAHVGEERKRPKHTKATKQKRKNRPDSSDDGSDDVIDDEDDDLAPASKRCRSAPGGGSSTTKDRSDFSARVLRILLVSSARLLVLWFWCHCFSDCSDLALLCSLA